MIHTPEKAEKQLELARKVATVHAKTVIDYTKSLHCPAPLKIALIQAVQDQYTKEHGI